MPNTNPKLAQIIQYESHLIDEIYNEMSKVIVGQKKLIEKLLICLLTGGHILLEGVPGLAKTLAIKTLTQIIDAKFSRIQFTPDLLPADITGTMIFNQRDNNFMIKYGPIFANFVLADEINRSPAKVQSALLEAMQEKQVTIADKTYQLPSPFVVLATQNPLEQEGTYPLSEAQTDRFMLKTIIDYPTKDEEREIIRREIMANSNEVNSLLDPSQVVNLQKLVRFLYLDSKIENYILDIVFATRNPENYGLEHIKHFINIGASPRASIALAIAARAIAFLNMRDYVIPEDVKNITSDILRHRIGLSFEAEADNIKVNEIICEILKKVPQP